METIPERPWANARMIIILAALYLVYFVVFAAYAVFVPFFPSEVRYDILNVLHFLVLSLLLTYSGLSYVHCISPLKVVCADLG